MGRWVTQLDTGADAKQLLLEAIEGTQLTEHDMMYALYCALKGKDIILKSKNLVYPKLRDAYIEARICERMLVSSDTAARIHKVILAYVSSHQVQAVRFEKGGIR